MLLICSRIREVSITAKPTVSEDHPAKQDDPQASLRAELLGQLVAAQFEIETVIADLARDGAPASTMMDSRNQLAALGALRQQLTGADVKALVAMRSDIAATVAASQSTAQQARSAAEASNTGNLANYAQNARAAVNDVMRNMKDFDPYLHFASEREEADYRHREEERRAYIAAEQAKHTPEGDLNASGGAVGQMADAAAHGATASPEFQKRWDALTASTEALRAQLIRDGKDVSQFDTHLREDLRSIMRAKGVPDAKIDALLAAHPDDPLEAVKAFVAEQKGIIGEKELGDLSRKAANYRDDAEERPATVQSSEPASPMVDAMAKLKASGVALASNVPEQPVHGIAGQAAVTPASSRSL